jgi:hypothetical protein
MSRQRYGMVRNTSMPWNSTRLFSALESNTIQSILTARQALPHMSMMLVHFSRKVTGMCW